MYDFTVVGYVVDCTTYCNECFPGISDALTDDDSSPIFAGDEDEHQCDNCGEEF